MKETLGIWILRPQALALGQKLQQALGGELIRGWCQATTHTEICCHLPEKISSTNVGFVTAGHARRTKATCTSIGNPSSFLYSQNTIPIYGLSSKNLNINRVRYSNAILDAALSPKNAKDSAEESRANHLDAQPDNGTSPQHLTQKTLFAQHYRHHRRWVLVMAAGIAVRFLQGLVADKHSDPAVVVLDEGGHHAISLLAGHEGGANQLAYKVANAVGAVPVVTTATEALKPLTIGIGCRKGVSAQDIEAAVLNVLDKRQLDQVREIATVDLKKNEAGLVAFCCRHNIPLRVISSDEIIDRPWLTKPSDWVKKNIGLNGVCEPCALLASTRGRLIVPKTTLNGVAVAVVENKMG